MVVEEFKPVGIIPFNVEITDYQEPITIDRFTIRKITPEEQEKYYGAKNVKYPGHIDPFKNFGKPLQYLYWEHSDKKCLAEGIFTTQEISKLVSCKYLIAYTLDETVRKNKNIENLLLAFRLYKDTGIFAPIRIVLDAPNNMSIVGDFLSLYGPNATRSHIISSGIYQVSSSELTHIENLYKRIEKNSHDGWRLAAERYSRAVSGTQHSYNTFIDFVTILESLFLEGTKDQLRFQFSLFVSYLLRNELDIPENFKGVREIYDVRSQLVHTGKPSKKSKYDEDLFIKTKDYTRKLLLWFLQNNDKDRNPKQRILKALNID